MSTDSPILLTPEQAVAELERLYLEAAEALRGGVERFLSTGEPLTPLERARYRYPELRVTYAPQGPMPVNRRAYGKFQGPGVYATTVTHPAAFRRYLTEQLRLLVEDWGARIEVRPGGQEIPYPYVFETGDELGRGHVPPWSVAVQASRRRDFPGGEFYLPCVLVLRRLTEGQRHDKAQLNDILRTHGVSM